MTARPAQARLEKVEEANELAAFAPIRDRARQTNLLRLAKVEAILLSWRDGVTLPGEEATVAALVHQIVGSAGTFGFDRVSELARQFEGRQRACGNDAALPLDLVAELARLVRVMRTELESEPAADHS